MLTRNRSHEAAICVTARLALKAELISSCMSVDRNEELDLCEECGSPLVDGSCRNCGGGFREGASPVGAAPLDRRQLSKVLGRSVGSRAHGSYALSMQQGERMAPVRKEIESLVEQFNASPEVKNSVKHSSERLALRLLDELGPTEAAIASVSQEFVKLGRNLLEVNLCISRLHPRMGQLKDLVVEVYPLTSEVKVFVDGRERTFKSHANGLYKKLRIPVGIEDGNAKVELRNANLTRQGYDSRRVRPLDQSSFVLVLDETNFELFKVLKEARLSGRLLGDEPDRRMVLRKYSIAKLPLTERILRENALLQRVGAEYTAKLVEKLRDGRGRSPRKLAEEALLEACESVVPTSLSDLMVERYHLKRSAVRSLVVMPELASWQG